MDVDLAELIRVAATERIKARKAAVKIETKRAQIVALEAEIVVLQEVANVEKENKWYAMFNGLVNKEIAARELANG